MRHDKRIVTLIVKSGIKCSSRILEHGGVEITYEGDVQTLRDEAVTRHVEVRLLEMRGLTAEGLRKDTWTYGDDLDTPLEVGDLVEVPFGYDNDPTVARVVVAGQPPAYKGWGMKWVNHRMIPAPDSTCNPF